MFFFRGGGWHIKKEQRRIVSSKRSYFGAASYSLSSADVYVLIAHARFVFFYLLLSSISCITNAFKIKTHDSFWTRFFHSFYFRFFLVDPAKRNIWTWCGCEKLQQRFVWEPLFYIGNLFQKYTKRAQIMCAMPLALILNSFAK